VGKSVLHPSVFFGLGSLDRRGCRMSLTTDGDDLIPEIIRWAMCMRYTEYSDGVHGCMRSGACDARDHVHSGARSQVGAAARYYPQWVL
jgi:hypothetical protein